MRISVCIESDAVRAIAGKMNGGTLEVSAWYTLPLPPECVAGGVIVNEEPVREALARLREKCPDAKGGVDVVINSGSILVKKATVPDIAPEKLLRLVESEFASMAEGRGELLYDYRTLRGAGASNEILCAAAEKNFIGGYIALFTGAGLKIRRIDAAASALAGLAQTDLLRGRTSILCAADGNTLNAVLFVDGAFAFFSSTRLFSARGTEESYAEIGRIVSSLMQFNASQRNGRAVGDVWFGGLTQAETAPGALVDTVAQSFSVTARVFGGSAQIKGTYGKGGAFPAAQYLCCVGDLYEGGREA